jgi:integrase/recombinase XerD
MGDAAVPMPVSATREFSLYSSSGARKYLNYSERQRALVAMTALPPTHALFCLTLAWAGARVSEITSLTPLSFQIERSVVSIQTLKRRKPHVREVPIPPDLMAALDRHFGLRIKQHDPEMARQRLWPFHRTTAWRIIKRVMALAGITGVQACPKGLRHGFGVMALRSVPITLLKKWLGHARLSTTEIYLAVCGDDELAFAAQFWTSTAQSAVPALRPSENGYDARAR